MHGAGERVCYIINDLLNRELIKQNFRFKEPLIKDDEDLEESKEDTSILEETIDQQMTDNSKLSLRKYFEYCDAKGIEEELLKDPNEQKAFEDDENEMIMPCVDPEDWQKEYDRVIKYIDKDIDAYGNVKESKDVARSYVEVTYMDEMLERIENISKYFEVVKEFLEGEGRKQLEWMIDYWTRTNIRITNFENKITSDKMPKIQSLNSESAATSNLTDELKQRTDNVKYLIDHYDQISTQLDKIQAEYEKRSKEIFDHDKLERLRDAVRNIKLEINQLTVQEGMYRTEVTKYQLQEKVDAFEMYNLLSNQDDHANKDDSFDFN